MIHAVLLNPTIDRVLEVEDFEAGKTLKASRVNKLPMGKALSVAYALTALGEKVRVTGLMGRFDEPFYTNFLKPRKIECDWIPIDQPVRSNITIIDARSSSVTHLREPGFLIGRDDAIALREKLKNRLKGSVGDGDWVIFSGSLPQGLSARTYRELITLCREQNANVLFDSNGRALVEGIRGKPHILKPNLVELEEIFQEKINGIQHIALKAKGLIDRGIQAVFVSMGEDGMLAANGAEAYLTQVKMHRQVNTVGCGDAMVAGLVYGISRKFSFSLLCKFGVACGAANTLGRGPGLIRRHDVDKLMEKIKQVKI